MLSNELQSSHSDTLCHTLAPAGSGDRWRKDSGRKMGINGVFVRLTEGNSGKMEKRETVRDAEKQDSCKEREAHSSVT